MADSRRIVQSVAAAWIALGFGVAAWGQDAAPPPAPATMSSIAPPPPPPFGSDLFVAPSGVPRLNLNVPNALNPTGEVPPEPQNPRPKSSRQYNGLISLLVSPEFGNFPTLGDYEFAWRPPAAIDKQGTNLAWLRNSFNMVFPIYEDDRDEFVGSVQFRNESFYGTDAMLVDSNYAFPHELWDARLGLGYRRKFDNNWIAGGNVVFGSVADKPFYSYRELYWSANAYMALPREGTNDAWLLAVLYNNLSPLRYPLPAVAYLYRPSDTLQTSLGIPFSVTWKPEERVTIDVSYIPIRTVHAQFQYMVALPLRFYCAYDWDSESYFLADRANYFDRLQYYEMRLTVGMKLFLSYHFGFDFSGGYAFQRLWFQGREYADRWQDRIDVAPGAFLSLQGMFLW